jgi:hypothetical protein
MALGTEIQAGDEVITRKVAPLMDGPRVKGHVPEGTQLVAMRVQGGWIAVEWWQRDEKTSGWILHTNLIGKEELARRDAVRKALDQYPRKKSLVDFKAYPQQSGNTCSAAAARNLLGHVTGNAPWEWPLFFEIVSEDHKGLAHLEDRLKQVGIDNPMALSAFGGTGVGIRAVINKRLPEGLKCDFREIPDFEERILLIVRSINNGWPVIAPVVSASLQHWITITGYDRDTQQLSTASFGTLSFDSFDTLNSWRSTPGGLLGKAFQVANEEHIGRCVLIYITKEGFDDWPASE